MSTESPNPHPTTARYDDHAPGHEQVAQQTREGCEFFFLHVAHIYVQGERQQHRLPIPQADDVREVEP